MKREMEMTDGREWRRSKSEESVRIGVACICVISVLNLTARSAKFNAKNAKVLS